MHWTYDELPPDSDLEQGDILRPSEELNAVLSNVHKHFCDEKYTGFLVLTQSCDLVIRNGRPKAPYIQICVIRPFRQVRIKLLESISKPVYPGAFSEECKYKFESMLRTLTNQNEQGRGLLFLYRDLDACQLAEDSVAFLRVSVSLRSEHYEVLKSSRTGRLRPAFRAKLGWLTGNLFDRPATPDWTDSVSKKDHDQLIADLMDKGIKWIPEKIVQTAQKHGIDLQKDEGKVAELLPKPPIERLASALADELNNLGIGLDEATLHRLKSRLRNSQSVKACLAKS
jgi:hypothetical protein